MCCLLFLCSSLPRSGRNAISHAFEVMRVPPEEVAAQFTLIDHELFVKIDLDELIGIGWIKKEKNQVAPNVVAYTRRFNHVRESNCRLHEILFFHVELTDEPCQRSKLLFYGLLQIQVSYWIIEEILNHESTKSRAEVISYFVRVCKRLHDLNNLHSLFAVISALRSASIYRYSYVIIYVFLISQV